MVSGLWRRADRTARGEWGGGKSRQHGDLCQSMWVTCSDWVGGGRGGASAWHLPWFCWTMVRRHTLQLPCTHTPPHTGHPGLWLLQYHRLLLTTGLAARPMACPCATAAPASTSRRGWVGWHGAGRSHAAIPHVVATNVYEYSHASRSRAQRMATIALLELTALLPGRYSRVTALSMRTNGCEKIIATSSGSPGAWVPVELRRPLTSGRPLRASSLDRRLSRIFHHTPETLCPRGDATPRLGAPAPGRQPPPNWRNSVGPEGASVMCNGGLAAATCPKHGAAAPCT